MMKPEGKWRLEALWLNALMGGVIILQPTSEIPSVLIATLFPAYLTVMALWRPRKAFLLFVGTKMTFDGLWFLKRTIFASTGIGPLELMVIPLIVLVLSSLANRRSTGHVPVLALLFSVWVALAASTNDQGRTLEALVRESGMFLGLVVGGKFLKEADMVEETLLMITYSTVFPIIASLVQVLLMKIDYNVLFYTLDVERGIRAAGIYYDAGTTSMVSLMSLICNAYFMLVGTKARRTIHGLLAVLSLNTIVFSGTRSVMIMALFILSVFIIRTPRKGIKILPLILIVGIVALPRLESVLKRTARDFSAPIDINQLLVEQDYRTMLTGRVGMWQDAWDLYRGGSSMQIVFGNGEYTNVHSTYFFLLVQIGAGGLLLYLFINMRLLVLLWRRGATNPFRNVAMVGIVVVLGIGTSLTAVVFTSMQWIIYMLVGGVISAPRGIRTMDPQSSSERDVRTQLAVP